MIKKMSTIQGSTLIARALKTLGVTVVFGIVGIPIVEVAEALIAEGIEFIAFRNEQSASYAAGAYGYLTGKPGVCLVVSGPGVIHALAGVANAQQNCWPLLLLGGSPETDENGTGAFQELDQVEACRHYCKFAFRPSSLGNMPSVIEKAFRTSFYGRPGACYVDLPADFIKGNIARDAVIYKPPVPPPPKTLAHPTAVENAARLLKTAKSPIIIIGKGAAYARAEEELRRFVDVTGFPFLPTPMAKGVISDKHPLCIASARSKALAEADVILLLGARLNWVLHFGHRFNPVVKIIQADVHPEEVSNNMRSAVSLVGHLPSIVEQLHHSIVPYKYSPKTHFLQGLIAKSRENEEKLNKLYLDDHLPMSYHRAYWEIKYKLAELSQGSEGLIWVNEGANSMDIARVVFEMTEPRSRLDAGTFATMGVGMGFAIAAQLVHPTKRVVAIVGDSAFGFSAMELETAARAKISPIIIVINNNGVYYGLDSESYANTNPLPPTALLPEVRYDLIANACGGKGWLVHTPQELQKALLEAWKVQEKPVLLNVMIQPGGKKKLEFGWQTKKNNSAKL
ncbi:uncharacterized protein VTP21DRAFT_4348 [Calcarisporiella thermophila]|uniref:uncharacterized protein n=1 Tax=Calcarisporiella thermophila TaxID=911321 RepID=UPI003742763D